MNDASRQAGGKKPPADRLSREQQKKLERVDALLQTRYMADLGPATEGWGRRQFLFLSVLGTSFAGINFFVWPFVHSMNPAADVAALATTDVDVEAIEPGQSITVVWQGKPIFIRHRTAEETRRRRMSILPLCLTRKPMMRAYKIRTGSVLSAFAGISDAWFAGSGQRIRRGNTAAGSARAMAPTSTHPASRPE